MGSTPTGPGNVTAAKAEARARARAARRDGPAADGEALAAAAVAAITALPGEPRVTAYVSYGTEPQTGPLLAALAAAGVEVLIPRVRGEDLEWCGADAPRATSAMGIEEPGGPERPLLPLRAMLVPALAASPRGDRLGKGGGFYDRVIAQLRASGQAPPVIAVLRDDDVWEDVPAQGHDERVDAILTPTRLIDCHASGG
ncbi:MAG: 5-formyltetrahydrofolate cyclo-ligase [bacterium]